MEAFLGTLPPYVHDFLGKNPPTDVFNILRELVCFAVLYSNDRQHIQSSIKSLLKKSQDREESEAVVPETHLIEPIKEETEVEIKQSSPSPPQKKQYNVRTGELIQEPSTTPNTFPEWWGRTDLLPPPLPEKEVPRKETQKQEEPDSEPESYGSSWISWDNEPNTPTDHYHSRMERAKSQIIPNLRSYPMEDNARLRNSMTSPNIKRHSTLNSKPTSAPIAPNKNNSPPTRTIVTTATKAARRISAPVCESPVSTVPPTSKFVSKATKQQLLREANSRSPATPTTSPPSRSSSVSLKQPRQTATVRARAEHARLQQEELAKKQASAAAPLVSSTSLRLKQRVNSGVDWDTIKKERRNTISDPPKKV